MNKRDVVNPHGAAAAGQMKENKPTMKHVPCAPKTKNVCYK